MIRRVVRVLVLCLSAAACAGPPPDLSFGGNGFQVEAVRQNLAFAQRNLGDMSVYRGRPAEAALACAQFEAIVDGLRNPANAIAVRPLVGPMILSGEREMRGALGIPMTVPPAEAAQALANASAALRRDDTAAVRAALSSPVFSLGPEATLMRLTNLPPLPDVESVVPMLTSASDSEFAGGRRFRR